VGSSEVMAKSSGSAPRADGAQGTDDAGRTPPSGTRAETPAVPVPVLTRTPESPQGAREALRNALALVRRRRRFDRVIPAAVVGLVTAGIAADFAVDLALGERPLHLVLETAGILLWILAVALVGRLLRSSWARANELAAALEHLRNAPVEPSTEAATGGTNPAVQDLVGLIDRQFGEWGLSPSEREVALLLLKGLSLRDIAAARQASDPTVRQQAQAVYRKARLAGRAELSAYFLEDLLAPPDGPTASPGPARAAPGRRASAR
jgi:DNA-binding CsgD family transcriptional regulator